MAVVVAGPMGVKWGLLFTGEDEFITGRQQRIEQSADLRPIAELLQVMGAVS